MTQIKLRRDTLANFTSSNPVLGLGEPAYETDTKKLKIGDGSTAYTQLVYFSSGGGSGTDITASLPLKVEDGVISLEVDGQTIQIVDGKLHANTDELGNEVNDLSGRVTATEADITTIQSDITDINGDLDNKVTLNTEQTITAQKTVPGILVDGGGVCLVPNRATGGFIGYEYWDNKGPAIDFRPYNYPGSTNNNAGDVILRSGIGGSSIYRFSTANLFKQQGNGTIDAVYFNSANLTAGDNITITGSYNDGYTISATGGSTPDNMVTTDTVQTISGYKTFSSGISLGNTLVFPKATQGGRDNLLRANMWSNDGMTSSAEPIFQLYTPDSSSNTKLIIGDSDHAVVLRGSSIEDNSGSNFLTDSSTNKATIASWGMPNTSDVSSKPTIGASGTEYTMPFNGYITLSCHNSSETSGFVSVDVLVGESDWNWVGGGGYEAEEDMFIGFVPVLKGSKYRIRYSNSTIILIQYPLLGGETA